MARRRLIDPSLWHSGHCKRLNLRQRLLWVGVITLADDEGKLKGEPAVIWAAIFPFDRPIRKVLESDLQRLSQEGLIELYEVGGDRYIRIVKWSKYQKPSHPTPSKIPDPKLAQLSGETTEVLPKNSGDSLDQVRLGKGRRDKGREGEVREGELAGSAAASAGASAEPASFVSENLLVSEEHLWDLAREISGVGPIPVCFQLTRLFLKKVATIEGLPSKEKLRSQLIELADHAKEQMNGNPKLSPDQCFESLIRGYQASA